MVVQGDSSASSASLVGLGADPLDAIASYFAAGDLGPFRATCRKLRAATSASRIFLSQATDDEMRALPRREGETWTELLVQLERLRRPLEFDALNVDAWSRAGGRSAFRFEATRHGFAKSPHVMRAGRHFGVFSIRYDRGMAQDGEPEDVEFGIIRPVPDRLWRGGPSCGGNRQRPFDPFQCSRERREELLSSRTAGWGASDVHCCTYHTSSGFCYSATWSSTVADGSSHHNWQGREALEGQVKVAGLLLDLDEGTLVVYKNRRRLGVMQRGLSGEYCWMIQVDNTGRHMCSFQVLVEKGTVPAERP